MSISMTMDFLALTSLSIAKSYWPSSSVEELQLRWAHKTLKKFDIDMDVIGQISHQQPLLFVGNHISYVDIVLLMATVPSISFVAKKEISYWPIFGKAAQRTKTILVKRESTDSRKAARLAIEQGLQRRQRIAIFPSGTTCIDEKKSWRRGAFEIAQNNNVMIQPFRISYTPLRTVAYIDDDFFPSHIIRLSKTRSIKAKIEFHPPVPVTDAAADCEKWWRWCQDF